MIWGACPKVKRVMLVQRWKESRRQPLVFAEQLGPTELLACRAHPYVCLASHAWHKWTGLRKDCTTCTQTCNMQGMCLNGSFVFFFFGEGGGGGARNQTEGISGWHSATQGGDAFQIRVQSRAQILAFQYFHRVYAFIVKPEANLTTAWEASCAFF